MTLFGVPSFYVSNFLGYFMGLFRFLYRLFSGPPPRPSVINDEPFRDARPVRHVAPVNEVPFTPPVANQKILRGRCWVIDGDTIVIDKIHLRLSGIDAPELDHPWGQKAKHTLMQLTRNQVITAHLDGNTSHERHVALCLLEDGRDLSAEMVRAGAALDWPKYSGGRYRELESPDARKRLWRVNARQKGKVPPRSIE